MLAGASEGGPTATSEDRVIRFGDGSSPEQRTAIINGMSYEDTVPFINYKANPNTIDSISVAWMQRPTLQWLNTHGYNINMTVQ